MRPLRSTSPRDMGPRVSPAMGLANLVNFSCISVGRFGLKRSGRGIAIKGWSPRLIILKHQTRVPCMQKVSYAPMLVDLSACKLCVPGHLLGPTSRSVFHSPTPSAWQQAVKRVAKVTKQWNHTCRLHGSSHLRL